MPHLFSPSVGGVCDECIPSQGLANVCQASAVRVEVPSLIKNSLVDEVLAPEAGVHQHDCYLGRRLEVLYAINISAGGECPAP